MCIFEMHLCYCQPKNSWRSKRTRWLKRQVWLCADNQTVFCFVLFFFIIFFCVAAPSQFFFSFLILKWNYDSYCYKKQTTTTTKKNITVSSSIIILRENRKLHGKVAQQSLNCDLVWSFFKIISAWRRQQITRKRGVRWSQSACEWLLSV